MIKKQSGLFERPFSDQSLLSYIGSQNHREIAREAVQKSMVVLKNDKISFLYQSLGKKL